MISINSVNVFLLFDESQATPVACGSFSDSSGVIVSGTVISGLGIIVSVIICSSWLRELNWTS